MIAWCCAVSFHRLFSNSSWSAPNLGSGPERRRARISRGSVRLMSGLACGLAKFAVVSRLRSEKRCRAHERATGPVCVNACFPGAAFGGTRSRGFFDVIEGRRLWVGPGPLIFKSGSRDRGLAIAMGVAAFLGLRPVHRFQFTRRGS